MTRRRGGVDDGAPAAIPGQGHLPPSLLRLSVGIEEVEDLWADLSEALRGDWQDAEGRDPLEGPSPRSSRGARTDGQRDYARV